MRERTTALAAMVALTISIPLTVPAMASAAPSATRVCSPSPRPRQMSCDAMILDDGSGVAADAISPDSAPTGYGPSDLVSAYDLPTTGGSGATVAVVDAFNNPRAAADLAVYRRQYGLAACTVASGCFTQVNQNGSTGSLPANDSGWAGEESLDVDMVSAICPACRILLVEASSTSDDDLFRAVDEAVALGAGYVSNSWGDPDFAGRPGDDAHFDHVGVAITASTGDSGAGTQYPATSRYVTAVGGTSLRRSSSGRGWTETAWSGAGSGCATGETRPSWQTVTTGCSGRAEADVAAVADPHTGVAVYQTYGEGGWVTYGGTSVAAPLIAAVYALAGTPTAGTYPASYPYLNPTRFFDVTSGANGGCGGAICTARTGWDGPTGLGTPDGVAAFTLGGPPSGTCDPAQLLADPGFESGAAGSWTMSSRVLNDTDLQPPHGGSWDAWLDGYGSRHVDTIEQSVTVPAGCTATLSFYLHISTEESTTTAANDSLAIEVDGHTVATYSNLDQQPGYTQHTIPLPDASGPTAVRFTGSENDSLATGFVIDDTELTVR